MKRTFTTGGDKLSLYVNNKRVAVIVEPSFNARMDIAQMFMRDGYKAAVTYVGDAGRNQLVFEPVGDEPAHFGFQDAR